MKNFKITSVFTSIVVILVFPNQLNGILLLTAGVVPILWLLFRLRGMRKEISLLKEEILYFMDSFKDIRTPMSMVQTPLATVCGDNCPESIRNAVLMVARNIESLDARLARLISLKQLFTHSGSLELAEYELGELLASRVFALREYAANRHVKVKLETKFSYGSAWLDLCKISPLIDKFITNAIDCTKPETCITVQVSFILDRWAIEVTDIEGDKLAKCYSCEKHRLFARRTSVREYVFAESLMCSELLKLCDGKIHIDHSNRTVSLQFPVKCANGKISGRVIASQIAVCREEDVIDVRFGKRQQKRNSCKPIVVLVDSNEEFRLYLETCLSVDFDVKGFGSGVEALAHIKENHPDVVICDTVLHEMNGDELSSRLKTSRETAIIPVILYGSQMDADRRYKREASMADLFLQKPVQIEDLKVEIVVLVRNSRALRKGFLQYAFGENFIVDGSEEGDDFVDKVKNMILENMGEKPVTVEDIYENLGMSRTAYYTKWKSLTGECPSQIIYKTRIEKGRELLESGLYDINDIPAMIGMNNVPYFRAEFKKYYKMTPTAWMKRYKSMKK